jgi:hypothetical protein
MFIYEDGVVVDYVPTGTYPEHIVDDLRERMLSWHRTLPGQTKVRLGKVATMSGQEVNLKRLANE